LLWPEGGGGTDVTTRVVAPRLAERFVEHARCAAHLRLDRELEPLGAPRDAHEEIGPCPAGRCAAVVRPNLNRDLPTKDRAKTSKGLGNGKLGDDGNGGHLFPVFRVFQYRKIACRWNKFH
jgi:hypothetical protein